MLPSEVLLAARELVAGGWTRHSWARDSKGEPVNIQSPDAVSFCVVGAVLRASGDNDSFWPMHGREALSYIREHDFLEAWNNMPETSHLDATVCLERAALLAMKEGR
jgi:hypothetical protein